MSRNGWQILWTFLAIVVFGAFVAGYTSERSAECESRGGVLVRSATLGYACVSPR